MKNKYKYKYSKIEIFTSIVAFYSDHCIFSGLLHIIWIVASCFDCCIYPHCIVASYKCGSLHLIRIVASIHGSLHIIFQLFNCCYLDHCFLYPDHCIFSRSLHIMFNCCILSTLSHLLWIVTSYPHCCILPG